MDTMSYKTVSANKKTANKEWVILDAEGQSLGRLASVAAKMIRGKHKPNFTPHADCGDNVIVVNAGKLELTGKKWEEKKYLRHTGHPGGQRSLTARQLYSKDPRRMVETAVKGMLPSNKLGAAIFHNLKVYVDDKHDYEAQKPKNININELV